MAQLVEQLIRNQQVAGSSPAISSIKIHPVFSMGCIFMLLTVGLCTCALRYDDLLSRIRNTSLRSVAFARFARSAEQQVAPTNETVFLCYLQ